MILTRRQALQRVERLQKMLDRHEPGSPEWNELNDALLSTESDLEFLEENPHHYE